MEMKTFRQLYDEEKKKPTAAQNFVADIAALTKRSEVTVRKWIAGQQEPDDLAKQAIGERFGIKADYLFPKTI